MATTFRPGGSLIDRIVAGRSRSTAPRRVQAYRLPSGKVIQSDLALESLLPVASVRDLVAASTPPPPPAPPPNNVGVIGDLASAFGQGAVGGIKSLTDIFGADNPVSSGLDSVSGYLRDRVSPERKAELELQEREKAALGPDASVLDRAGLFARQAIRNPGTTIAEGVGNIVPLVAASALAPEALAARALTMGTGAAMGVGAVKGGIYDTTLQGLLAQGVPEDQARARASQAQSYAENPGLIAAGAVEGAIAARFSADEAIASMVNMPAAMARAALKEEARKATLLGALRGAAREVLTEGPQESLETYLGNRGAIDAGVNMDPNQGVLEAGVKAAIMSAVPGAGATYVSGRRAKAQLDGLGPEVPTLEGEWSPPAAAGPRQIGGRTSPILSLLGETAGAATRALPPGTYDMPGKREFVMPGTRQMAEPDPGEEAVLRDAMLREDIPGIDRIEALAAQEPAPAPPASVLDLVNQGTATQRQRAAKEAQARAQAEAEAEARALAEARQRITAPERQDVPGGPLVVPEAIEKRDAQVPIKLSGREAAKDPRAQKIAERVGFEKATKALIDSGLMVSNNQARIAAELIFGVPQKKNTLGSILRRAATAQGGEWNRAQESRAPEARPEPTVPAAVDPMPAEPADEAPPMLSPAVAAATAAAAKQKIDALDWDARAAVDADAEKVKADLAPFVGDRWKRRQTLHDAVLQNSGGVAWSDIAGRTGVKAKEIPQRLRSILRKRGSVANDLAATFEDMGQEWGIRSLDEFVERLMSQEPTFHPNDQSGGSFVAKDIAAEAGLTPKQAHDALVQDRNNPRELAIKKVLAEKDPFDSQEQLDRQRDERARSAQMSDAADPEEGDASFDPTAFEEPAPTVPADEPADSAEPSFLKPQKAPKIEAPRKAVNVQKTKAGQQILLPGAAEVMDTSSRVGQLKAGQEDVNRAPLFTQEEEAAKKADAERQTSLVDEAAPEGYEWRNGAGAARAKWMLKPLEGSRDIPSNPQATKAEALEEFKKNRSAIEARDKENTAYRAALERLKTGEVSDADLKSVSFGTRSLAKRQAILLARDMGLTVKQADIAANRATDIRTPKQWGPHYDARNFVEKVLFMLKADATEERKPDVSVPYQPPTTKSVDRAAAEAAKPTEAQADAGNYKKGHVRLGGLGISIENEAGSKRRPEWPALNAHYGYVKGTEGKDGDHLDVFIKPGTPRNYDGPVFVVNQTNAKGGFDEHKAMIGWPNEEAALAAYKENYTPGWDRFTGLGDYADMGEFKRWIKNADLTKPAPLSYESKKRVADASKPARPAAKKKKPDTGVKYAIDDDVSPDRDLIIQHNLTAANVIHADKLGGLPVPSFGVARYDMPLEGFGEITLLGDRSLADPKESGMQVYGGDIYSPRYPPIRYKFQKPSAIDSALKESAQAIGYSDWQDEAEKNGGDSLASNPNVAWAFLKSKGIAPAVRLEGPTPERLAQLKAVPGLEAFFGRARWTNMEDPEFQPAAMRELKARYASLGKAEQNALTRGLTEDQKQNIARHLAYELEDIGKNRVARGQTGAAMRDQIKAAGLEQEFDRFHRALFEKAAPESRISTGYTYSGRLRTIPHTLENVVKILKANMKAGENFSYGPGTIRGAVTPRFTSIEKIRAAKDRLVSKADMERVKEEINGEFWKVAEQIPTGGGIGSGDRAVNFMVDVAKLGMGRAMREWNMQLAPRQQAAVGEFMEKLKAAPTEYFEAKLPRAVGFDEFKAAVVPDNADPRAVQILERKGLSIERYKAGDQGARKAAIARATDGPGMRFSVGGDGAPGFFSQLERAAGTLRGPMPARDAFAILKKSPGVKADEMKWTGLDDFLGQKGTAKVTPAEVQEFLKTHKVTIKEVTKGASAKLTKAEVDRRWIALWKPGGSVLGTPATATIDATGYDVYDDKGQPFGSYSAGSEAEAIYEANRRGPTEFAKEGSAFRAEFEAIRAGSIEAAEGQPKFSQYQEPGGANYREVLLTLPTKPVPPVAHRVQERRVPRRMTQFDVVRSDNGQTVNSYFDRAEAEVRARTLSRLPAPAWDAPRFRSSHFDEPNILAHVRLNDRMVDGKRVLFVEEVQSDWAQQGRKTGFAGSVFVPQNRRGLRNRGMEFETREEAEAFVRGLPEPVRNDIDVVELPKMNGTAPAPFVERTEDWTALAMKSILHKAATEGYDSVAWTTGDMQADRYDLSKQVDEIAYEKNADGTYRVEVSKGDTNLDVKPKMSERDLEGYVGKEIAQKILDGEGENDPGSSLKVFRGAALKVGGEGMRAFYDKIIPQVAEKIAKKWGAKVEALKIPKTKADRSFNKKEIADAAVRLIRGDIDAADFIDDANLDGLITEQEVWELEEKYSNSDRGDRIRTRGLAEAMARELVTRFGDSRRMTVQSIPITPQMRESVKTEGFPLFAKGEATPADARVSSPLAIEQVRRAIPGLNWKPHPEGGFVARLRNGRDLRVLPDATFENIDPEAMSISSAANPVPGGTGRPRGSYSPAKTLIKIASGAKLTTLDHEGLHMLWDLALSNAERDALMRKFGGEEEAAYAYEKWVTEPAATTWWGRAFQKVRDLARRIVHYFRPTWESTFAEARSGRAAQRVSGDGTTTTDRAATETYGPKDPRRNENFRRWFGDSKVVDESGKPLVVYHGTTAEFHEFSSDWMYSGEGASHSGSGFYFTTSPESASNYSTMARKAGSNVMPVYLALKKPLYIDFEKGEVGGADLVLTPAQVRKIILSAPNIRDSDESPLLNFNDVNRYGFDKVLAEAIKAYAGSSSIAALRNDFFGNDHNAWLRALSSATGYDSAYSKTPNGDTHYVAWFPEQIKSATGNNGNFDPSNPDIRYSTEDAEPAEAPEFTPPEETFLQRAEHLIRNSLNRVGVVTSAWEKQTGKKTPRDFEESFGGIQPRARAVVEAAEVSLAKPITSFIARHKLDFDLLGRLAMAVHAPAADKALTEEAIVDAAAKKLVKLRAEDPTAWAHIDTAGEITVTTAEEILGPKRVEAIRAKMGNPSGMSPERIAEIRARVNATGKAAAYEEARQMILGVQDVTNALRVEKGLASQEQVDRWREKYGPDFVHLWNDDADIIDRFMRKGSRGYGVKGAEVQRRRGRKSEAAAHPLISAVQDLERTILRAEKMTSLDGFARWVEENPELGTVRAGEPDKDGVGFKRNGQQYSLDLADPILKDQLQKLTTPQIDVLTQTLGSFTRMFSRINTVLSPPFVLKNSTRDYSGAVLSSIILHGAKGGPTGSIAAKVATNQAAAIKGVYRYMKDPAKAHPAGSWEQAVGEALRHGAIPGYFNAIESMAEIRSKLEAAIKDGMSKSEAFRLGMTEAQAAWADPKLSTTEKVAKSSSVAWDATMRGIGARKAFDMLMDLNKGAEIATRVNYFKALRDGGMSAPEAAAKARNLTDFNKRGEYTTMANAVWSFFNANVQGTTRLAEMVTAADPKVRARAIATMAGLFGAGLLWNTMIGALAGDDDDDGIPDSDQMPDWADERNLVIPAIGNLSPILIPLAQGFNVPFFAGIVASKLLNGRVKKADAAAAIVGAAINSYNPIGTLYGVPTAIQPGIEVLGNKDWAGRPVTPTRFPGQEGLPDSQLAFRKTSAVAKNIATSLNRITGGDESVPGYVDVSPATLDHFARYFGGGAGRFMQDAVDAVVSLVKGEEPGRVPFASSFLVDTNRAMESRYFEQLHSLDILENQIKSKERVLRAETLADAAPNVDVGRISLADLRKATAGLPVSQERIAWMQKALRDLDARRLVLKPVFEAAAKAISKLKAQPPTPERDAQIENIYLRLNREWTRVTGGVQ